MPLSFNAVFDTWDVRCRRLAAALAILLYLPGIVGQGSAEEAEHPAALSDELRERAVGELKRSLTQEKEFAKVHAAEALLALGYGDDVAMVFRKELRRYGDEPHYRTGVWRVLARAAPERDQQAYFVQKLVDDYFDAKSPDRTHALEALAKLRYSLSPDERRNFITSPLPDEPDAAPCLQWLLALSDPDDERPMQELGRQLVEDDSRVSALSAYALWHLGAKAPSDMISNLTNAALRAPRTDAGVNIVAAAFTLTRDKDSLDKLRRALIQYAEQGSSSAKYQAAMALADRGDARDVPLLRQLLDEPSSDVRTGAAYALLRIDRRKPLPFQWLDAVVMVAYAVGMLLVGWFYSRVKNVEEYLLGGRTMRPWAVGISLFATLMSTLTYLAMPGEMIQHGPMMLAALLSFPLVYVVVGRFIIPYIMRLRITSAYEILERRLGLSVRMLGAALFLLTRLLWMALIVYATSAEVLIPLLRLDPSWTPWVCTAMALLTVAYTSMGGLQAVVVTDVLQTAIMFLGAILSLVLITRNLGGVGAWWPTSWYVQWDEPRYFFSSGVRVSMGMAILSQFTWYVCTVGSDQMAIQRYLATEDERAARRMFGVSLIANALVYLLLAALGLALFAYFRRQPALLPDGGTLMEGADQLLPQYIVLGLPAGVSGLVIAGILSAAMDSLSSGINSSCSVILVDWIDRFRGAASHEKEQVREAKLISWIIGLAVVALSLCATLVSGNLMEKCYTVVNVMVGPSFVLFFLAMFVPWARAAGAWAGVIAGLAVAFGIGHFQWFNLRFLWIMPASLVVGIAVGCLVSLLPVGRPRPMLELKPS